MHLNQLPSPCYVVDEAKLIDNLEILALVMQRTGCCILLAQKAFAMYPLYPLIGQYLSGTAASGLYEARLGAEEMRKENHIYAPAYRADEFEQIITLCDHIIFNSFAQLQRFGPAARRAGRSIGLRINPECSTQSGPALYDPCAPASRLGVSPRYFKPELLVGVDGLHFHTLCEQDADALLTTLQAVEEGFGPWLSQMKWLNLGGGHLITSPSYDLSALEDIIDRLQMQYGLKVYLEPGEAVALNAGHLICTVLDLMHNDMDIALLDVSAACHMPDVLEMPYRPPLMNAGQPQEKLYTYRLGGMSCLAGDIIGDYSFDAPLAPGDRLLFEDMAIYTMVKNNTFNGMPLPAIALQKKNGDCRLLRQFGYEDFKMRLS